MTTLALSLAAAIVAVAFLGLVWLVVVIVAYRVRQWNR